MTRRKKIRVPPVVASMAVVRIVFVGANAMRCCQANKRTATGGRGRAKYKSGRRVAANPATLALSRPKPKCDYSVGRLAYAADRHSSPVSSFSLNAALSGPSRCRRSVPLPLQPEKLLLRIGLRNQQANFIDHLRRAENNMLLARLLLVLVAASLPPSHLLMWTRASSDGGAEKGASMTGGWCSRTKRWWRRQRTTCAVSPRERINSYLRINPATPNFGFFFTNRRSVSSPRSVRATGSIIRRTLF